MGAGGPTGVSEEILEIYEEEMAGARTARNPGRQRTGSLGMCRGKPGCPPASHDHGDGTGTGTGDGNIQMAVVAIHNHQINVMTGM